MRTSHDRARPSGVSWPEPRVIRGLLGGLLAVGAVNAFAGGSYAMGGAWGIPRDWLDLGPFDTYFVPGVVLFAVVGGACLLAAIAVFGRWRSARRLAQLAAGVVLAFIFVEMTIIGSPFWLQPVSAIAAAAIIALSRALPREGGA